MRIHNMISTRNFTNPSHAKIGAGTIMQEATSNEGNLSSKLVALKWDLISIKLRLEDSGTHIFALTQNIER